MLFKVDWMIKQNKDKTVSIQLEDMKVTGDLGKNALVKWLEKKPDFSELKSTMEVRKWRIGCEGKRDMGL